MSCLALTLCDPFCSGEVCSNIISGAPPLVKLKIVLCHVSSNLDARDTRLHQNMSKQIDGMASVHIADFDPYRPCPPSDYTDTDLEHFSDTSKEDAESREGSVTSAETNDSIENETDHRTGKVQRLTLMDLPVEIRLEIYSCLHLRTPVKHPELAPWYPTPKYGTCFLKSIRRTLEVNKNQEESDSEDSEEGGDEESGLLSPWRPASALPTALLRTNRQIYHEARVIPFRSNEFVFVNWFSSGLWAARTFTRNRAVWQQNEMRYTRLEIQVADFQGVGLKEWNALCGQWSNGLWGLRLKVACMRARDRRSTLVKAASMADVLTALTTTAENEEEGNVNEEESKVLETLLHSGISKLKALKRLELELDWAEWGDELKVRMAEEMESHLNKERSHDNPVQVVSVRRIKT